MRKRFKVPLTLVAIVIFSTIALLSSYYIFYNPLNNPHILLDTPLSINYQNTEIITINNHENIKFSVTNNGSEDESYYIYFDGTENNDEITFKLTGDNNFEITGEFKNEIIATDILIKPGETHNFILDINSNNASILSGKILVKKEQNKSTSFAEIIIDNSDVKSNPLTKVAKEEANTDEGLIKFSDSNSEIYYFRGAVSNNYVDFAGDLWRIMKINEDNSVKLVLNNNLSSLSSYYSDEYTNFKDSNIKTTLDNFYNTSLLSYEEYLLNHKYCEDNSIVDSQNNIYATFSRVFTLEIASSECLGTEINSKIGLLTVDEVLYAGATGSDENESFYLYNEDITTETFLMSGAKESGSTYYPFALKKDGSLTSTISGTLVRGVRPVINLNRTVEVTGTGTIDEPYKVITD